MTFPVTAIPPLLYVHIQGRPIPAEGKSDSEMLGWAGVVFRL